MSFPGKPEWRTMLTYVAELHIRSVHPAAHHWPHPWEEIGRGYCYAPAFGHWDIVHQAIDQLATHPEHAANQLRNLLAGQQDDGFLPGAIYFKDDKPWWGETWTHPPVWPMAVDMLGDSGLMAELAPKLVAQISWFERNRRAHDGVGFFYADVTERKWESGVDEGVRFDDAPKQRLACVNATSHLYACYEAAARWTGEAQYKEKAEQLAVFIQKRLYDPNTGWFHDAWDSRPLAFEGMWPMVVGAATEDQGWSVLQAFLDPTKFFSPHPIRTVSATEAKREKRMWRGPAWNSMTLWAAGGCVRLGHPEAARQLLEPALDSSARWFEVTGTIWEFYDAEGGDPREVARKPHTPFNRPSPDYLGHNPLLAMARLWEECEE
ncbi:trehalase family glycosidase [Armatimonas sp.]|uniref:MGH1-like glycoside hydrolase domain-containing protein n=1 Tax=Armatimonas sp. TaxID=1872638 RepID=UPI00286B9E58|nr:trehalase family glycosidase [Armatimonas sp.]